MKIEETEEKEEPVRLAPSKKWKYVEGDEIINLLCSVWSELLPRNSSLANEVATLLAELVE